MTEIEFPLVNIIIVLGLIAMPFIIVAAVKQRKKMKRLLQEADALMAQKKYRDAYEAYRKYLGMALFLTVDGKGPVFVANPFSLGGSIEKCSPVIDKLHTICQTAGLECDLSPIRQIKEDLDEFRKDRSLFKRDGNLTRDGQPIFEAMKKKVQEVYDSMPSPEEIK